MTFTSDRIKRLLSPVHSTAVLMALWAAVVLSGCSQSDTTTQRRSEEQDTLETSALHQPVEADKRIAASWIQHRSSWPDTLRFDLGEDREVLQDSLLLRLQLSVSQDVTGLNFMDERPLLAEVLMTIRPVPQYELVKALKIDSLRLHDPVGDRDLPTLPMLSFQRSYENEVLRTQFLLNMAERYRISPDLQEGQLLEPTLYLSWGKRIIIATHPPVELIYMREIS